MLTFDQFLAENNNQYVTVLSPGKQCFDLVVKWTDNLGIPHAPNNPSPFPFENAYQIYTGYSDFQRQYFDRIQNSWYNYPQKGDVVVWSSAYNNGAGHTGIATGNGNWWNFDCFEQNDPLGAVSHVRTYNYKFVLGWLRPKVTFPNADEYVAIAKGATQTLVNAVDTGLQVGDPDYKSKMADTKSKLEAVIAKL